MLNIKKSCNFGFSLVELSLVLIIIGIVVGGILLGKDMIEAARVQATIAQIQKYNTSVNVFKLKYNALPGDMNKASSMLSFTITATDGNGDGYITDNRGVTGIPLVIDQTGSNVTINELPLFWQHLSIVELIDGGFDGSNDSIKPGINFPNLKIGNQAMFAYTDSDNKLYWYLGAHNVPGSSALSVDALGYAFTSNQAYNVELKIDDGIPMVGNAVAQGARIGLTNGEYGARPPFTNVGINFYGCVTPVVDFGVAAAQYDLRSKISACNMRIKAAIAGND